MRLRRTTIFSIVYFLSLFISSQATAVPGDASAPTAVAQPDMYASLQEENDPRLDLPDVVADDYLVEEFDLFDFDQDEIGNEGNSVPGKEPVAVIADKNPVPEEKVPAATKPPQAVPLPVKVRPIPKKLTALAAAPAPRSVPVNTNIDAAVFGGSDKVRGVIKQVVSDQGERVHAEADRRWLGFTFLELLTIFGFAGTIAILTLIRSLSSTKKERVEQAASYLKEIRKSEGFYYAMHQTYIACADAAAIKANLGVDVVMETYTFKIEGNPHIASTFKASATRNGSTASSYHRMTIDQDGFLDQRGE